MESVNKVMTMKEAISKYVHDGDYLVLGGFVTNRKPYAAVREIIRQGLKDLYVDSGPGGGDIDMLVGAGCVKVLMISFVGNSGYTPVCRRVRKAIEEQTILWEDYSLDAQTIMYHAAALGIPYVPIKDVLGSSMIDRWGIPPEVWEKDPKLGSRKLVVTNNFFNPEEKVCVLPTPKIDTAIIHVQRACADGTCRIDGPSFIDIDIAMGATNCIVTCEELVDEDELRKEPWLNSLPSLIPDAVVQVPYGAHPSQCANYYDYDPPFFRMYDQVSRSAESFKEYLNEWVYGVEDNDAYIDKLGAIHLKNLRVKPGPGYFPGLQRR